MYIKCAAELGSVLVVCMLGSVVGRLKMNGGGGGGGDAELRHIRPPILTTIFCASLATMLATLSPFMLHIIPENSSAANECMPCTHRLRPPYRMWVVCVRLDLVCDRRSRC